MEQIVWIFLGLLATLATFGAFVRTVPQAVAQLTIVFAAMLWFYWAISAGDITVTTNCCVQHYTYNGAMFLGLGAGLINVLLLIDSLFGLIGLGQMEGTNAT